MELPGGFSRFLIVSLGSIGKRHARNLRTMFPHGKIAALRLTGSGKNPQSSDCDVELTDLDSVRDFAPHVAIIASPASTHVELASALLSMGVPTLIEKPLSNNLQDAKQLVSRSADAAVPVMIGYNLRFLPAFETIRGVISSGVLGNIVSVRAEVGQYLPGWRPDHDYRLGVSANRSLGGGAMLELSHEIDYLYWLFGMPDSVFAVAGKYSELQIDVEDLAEIIMTFEQPRRVVSVHLDFLQHTTTRKCRFIGTNGELTWDGIGGTLEIAGPAKDETDFPAQMTLESSDTYIAELNHFLECIENGTQPLISAVDGFNVLAIVEAARESARTGRVVKPEQHNHD